MNKIDTFFLGLLAPMGMVLALLMVMGPAYANEQGLCQVGNMIVHSSRDECNRKNGTFDAMVATTLSVTQALPQCVVGRELVVRMSGHYGCAVDVKEAE